jgi:hypothetical protein
MNESEAQNARDDQKDRDNVIEQLRHNQDQDAGEQRDDRLKVCDAYGHFFIPYGVPHSLWSSAARLFPPALEALTMTAGFSAKASPPKAVTLPTMRQDRISSDEIMCFASSVRFPGVS